MELAQVEVAQVAQTHAVNPPVSCSTPSANTSTRHVLGGYRAARLGDAPRADPLKTMFYSAVTACAQCSGRLRLPPRVSRPPRRPRCPPPRPCGSLSPP